MVDAHRGGRADAGGAHLRRARLELPAGGRAVPVGEETPRPGLRLVRRVDLRVGPGHHHRRRRHGRRAVRRAAHEQVLPHPLRRDEAQHHPPVHAGHAGRADVRQHRGRSVDGLDNEDRRRRGDRSHVRARRVARGGRVPSRVRLPLHHAGRGDREAQPARGRLRREVVAGGRVRGHPGTRLHLLRVRVGRRRGRGGGRRQAPRPEGHHVLALRRGGD